MNYKISFIIIFMFITGCEQNNLNKNSINQKTFDKYKNTGFGLVYDSSLKNKKKNYKKN